MSDPRPTVAGVAPFLPGVALLAIWIVWIPADGGYFPRAWYPAALFVVTLLVAVAAAARRFGPRSGSGRLALALLGGFTAWSFASLLWADSPGSAWTASDQLLLYLAMAWLTTLVPWRPGAAAALLGIWSIAVAVACAVELVSALHAANLGHYLLAARWQQPTGYANSAAAIAAMGCWPALMLASRRSLPAPLQVVFVVVAAFLAEFALLPQSRGALLALVLTLPVFVALAPDRPRVLLRLAIVAVAIAIAGPAIWNVFGAGEAGRSLHTALDRAGDAMLVSLAVVAAGGIAAAIAERRVHPGPRVAAAARTGSIAALLAAVLAAVVLGVAHAGSATDYVGDRWAEFKSHRQVPDKNPSRIFQHGSDKRYDYWRVSVAMLRAAPLGGAGAGGFERVYTRERSYVKPSRSPHSMWMRSLGELGAVGMALLIAFIAALGVGLLRARRRADDRARGIVAGCAAVGVYFVAHASTDWLELMPALAAPAVALAFLALGAAEPAEAAEAAEANGGPVRLPRVTRRLGAIGGAALAAIALVALALPYLSVRYVDSGLHRSATDYAGALRDLDSAASFDPLAPEPHYAAGGVALDHRRYADARHAFEQALETEDGWYPHFELALLDARQKRFRDARREIALAHALNPPDLLVLKAVTLISQGKRVDPRAVDRKALSLPLYKDPRHQ